MSRNFVEELEEEVQSRMRELDLLKDSEPAAGDRSEVVRRLKVALKNELEASELAALWMPSTPEVDVKLGLARQAGDEARHYHLIAEHLEDMGVDLSDYDPLEGGYSPMFELLRGYSTTVERVAAAQFTRETLALTKNRQFIEFCDALGDGATASLYRDRIQPDEEWHVRLGRRTLERYATSDELQGRARRASDAVLELALKIQNRQLHEMKISHAPGC